MQRLIDEIIASSAPYNFENGPQRIHDLSDALDGGMNCVAVAHLAIGAATGLRLPEDLLCWEMYGDSRFKHISEEDATAGDVIWFGPRDAEVGYVPMYDSNGSIINWTRCPVKHVAVYTGRRNEVGENLLLHTSFQSGVPVLATISDITTEPKHEVVVGLSRLDVSRAA